MFDCGIKEKEGQSAMKKFHQYAFGREVLVQSDHKPLERITLKMLCNAPKRLQGMLMNILQYDVRVKHIKGSAMYFRRHSCAFFA